MNSINLQKLNTINKTPNKQVIAGHVLPAQKSDSFESSSKNFNIDDAMTELKSIEVDSLSKKPLFDDEQLGQIKNELTQTPEKYEPFKTLAKSSMIKGDIACRLLTKDIDSLKELAEISKISKDDYFKTQKFKPEQIETLANELSAEELHKCKYLAQSISSISSLKKLSKNKNLKAPEKVAHAIQEMNDFYGKNCSVEFYEDFNDSKAFVCSVKSDNISAKQLFNSDMKRIALEESKEYKKHGEKFLTKKGIDYRTNTISKTVEKTNPRTSQTELISEVRVVRDKNGKKIRTEYATKSDVAGILNIKHSLPNGSIENISSASVNPKTGVTTIEKNMTSLDGTKTEYSFVEDRKGNRTSNYKITDKNGNVLMNNNQKLEVITDNKTISTNNDKKYEMIFTDKNVNIKNLNNGKTSNIDFENFVIGNKENAIKLLKKMSGEELLALKKNVKQLNVIDDSFKCSYSYKTGILTTCSDASSLLHELGHAKDTVSENSDWWYKDRLISSNKDVLKTYNKEKELFYKNFPITQRTHVSYFTEDEGFGLGETVAETNSILNYHTTENLNSVRSQYLQQYFPQTIAQLSKELNK